jgi:hypothetical protein
MEQLFCIDARFYRAAQNWNMKHAYTTTHKEENLIKDWCFTKYSSWQDPFESRQWQPLNLKQEMQGQQEDKQQEKHAVY